MTEQVTITEARARLGELVNEVRYRGGGIMLTKNGKSVAALVPAHIYEVWRADQERTRDAVQAIQSSFATEGEMTEEEAEEWAAEAVNQARREIAAEKAAARDPELIATP